jgi:hypothetical protein
MNRPIGFVTKLSVARLAASGSQAPKARSGPVNPVALASWVLLELISAQWATTFLTTLALRFRNRKDRQSV